MGTLNRIPTSMVDGLDAQLADIAYDVRQPPYNAKCNGIDDDSIAIQNAINDAKTNGGGTIYFPKATYTIKNTITLSNTPTIWFRSGSNERNTKLSWYGASGGLMFDGINLTYFKAEGLEFDGRTIAGIGFKIRSDGTAPSFSNNFQNCYFDRFTDKAVQLGDYTQSGRDDEVEFTLFQNCYFDTNNVGLFIDTLEAVDTHLIKCGFIGSSTSISQYHIRLHRAGQVVMNGGFFTHAQIDFYLESGWVSLNDIDSETGLHENGQFLVANGYNQGDLAPGRAQKLITLKNILSHAKGDATNNRAIDVKCGPGIEFDNCQFMGNVYLGGDCRQVINNGLNLLDYSGVTGYTGFIANPSIQFQTFGSGLNTQQVAEIYEPIHTAHGTLSVGSGVTTINVDMIANSKYGFFDTNYTVMVTPQWNTTFWITNKQDSGFTINFGTAPASATKVEWTALRSYSNRPSAMM